LFAYIIHKLIIGDSTIDRIYAYCYNIADITTATYTKQKFSHQIDDFINQNMHTCISL